MLVLIGKVALVAPAATVTLGGTAAAAGLPLDNVTTAPPAGAGPLRVKVPCALAPPVTKEGTDTEDNASCTVIVTELEVVAPKLSVTVSLAT